jgi:hypothetical protein
MNTVKITIFAFVFATANSIFILLSQIFRWRGYNFKLKYEKAKFETINNSIPILFLVAISLVVSIYLYEKYFYTWQEAPVILVVCSIILASILVILNILYQLKN